MKITDKIKNIQDRLIERIDNNLGVTTKDLKSEDMQLFKDISNNGGFVRIFNSLGIDIENMILKYGFSENIDKRTLDPSEIEQRLLYLKSIGKLTTLEMRKNHFPDNKLERSIKKVYGSVENCLKALNLERDYRFVDKDYIESTIWEYYNKGVDLSYSNMMQHDPKLIYNVGNHYDVGYHDLLKNMGISFNEKRIPYTHDSIKQRLEYIYKTHNTLRYAVVKENDPSILYYAHNKYGSYEKLLIDMGYDVSEFIDYDTLKSKGFQFESLVRDILIALGYKISYNKVIGNYRPDFITDDNVIIDAKLSAWTQSIDDTISKYTNTSSHIKIIYLRGDKLNKWSNDEYKDIEFIKVHSLFNELSAINRHDLIDRVLQLESSLKNDSNQESATTTRYALVEEQDEDIV